MSLFGFLGINLSTMGYLFGIDLLFWAWAFFTVIAFIDILIPDPIPYIDEIVLVSISVVLLFLMAIRGSLWLIQDAKAILFNPGLIAFVLTLSVLMIISAIYKKGDKK